MVASIRVPKTQRARRELLKHAPKLVSFLFYPSSHPCSIFKTFLGVQEWGGTRPLGGCPGFTKLAPS